MRSLRKSWIGIVLAILFMASIFLFRGASRYSNLFNSDNIVANISGTPISTTKFLRVLDMNISQFGQMLGKEINGDEIRSFQIHQLVLQNLVNNAIFENEFEQLDFLIDESIIAKNTKKRFPNLYVNNKLNDNELNSFLRQQRLKIDDLVNIVSYEIKAEIFDELFFANNYPNELVKKINKFDNQSRKVEILEIPIEKIKIENYNKSTIAKDNSDLINFYNNNKEKYLSEEKRDVSYILIEKENYKNDFIPSNIQIEEYYKNNINLFKTPEKRTFQQFNFKSEKEANEFKISTSGLSKEDFKKYILDNNIKFNNFEKLSENEVLDELASIIFNLKIDQVSNVVKTTLAHHVIILEEIYNERQSQLNEIKYEIKETLTFVKLDNFFSDLKSKISSQILDGYSINEIANKNSLVIKKLNKISNNTNEIDDKMASIVQSAFLLNKDYLSDLSDFDNNNSYIINVDKIYETKTQDIDIIFDQLTADFIIAKKIEYIENIYSKYKEENNLDKINEIFDASKKIIETKINNENLPSNILKIIFQSDVNKVLYSSDKNKIYFTKVTDINIPSSIGTLSEINLLSDLKNSFGSELIKSKNISFNDELIDGLLSQYK